MMGLAKQLTRKTHDLHNLHDLHDGHIPGKPLPTLTPPCSN